MWIVHIQLDRTEQVLNSRVGCITSIDEVLVAATHNNLAAKQQISTQQWTEAEDRQSL